jgi:hypothetical protein|nr:hypothetical protein [Neorhizobium tomejilense]
MSNTDNRTFYFYAGRPEVVVDDLTVVYDGDAEPGVVKYGNAWGGFVHSMSEKDFAEKFVRVPDEQIQALLNTFEAIDISIGDDCEDSIPGYTNGERWNGWLVPYFSLETIQQAMTGDGMLAQHGMDRVARFLYVPERDDVLSIEPEEGGEFENGAADRIDFARIREIATTVPDAEAEDLYRAMGLNVFAARKTSILNEGQDKPTTVYNIGDGWCWDVAMSPAPSAKPTSPTP